jgi:hypothetical protein
VRVREVLQAGGKVSLRNDIPPSVEVVVGENTAQRNFDYQLTQNHRRQVDTFEGRHGSMLILTRYNATARSFRGFFNRRIPLWEGHTRSGLETLVNAIGAANGDRGKLAEGVVTFMSDVGRRIFVWSASPERCPGNGLPVGLQTLRPDGVPGCKCLKGFGRAAGI